MANMASNNVSEIMTEIETLKSTKSQIETRISLLESQLHHLQNISTSDKLNNNNCNNNPQVNFQNGLTTDQIYRYSRHLLLPSFGVQAQAKLLKSSILVIGAGGLGSPALLYLAACGAGKIGIVDHDVVEMNNLQRQIIHSEAYIGRPKVESAAAACRAINSTVEIVEHKEAFRTSNALEIMSQYGLVIDATDNAPSRYMINDCCVVLGKVSWKSHLY
ncbi:hypothetical protein Leryth_014932 [Lithospermum erythrorhizon]|nr:hypothetical protein Leryth_014932 [Lithospermum erythrorhizon]